ncbi:hypothetical protein R5R35_009432 [Gryllus longicercus]|uniref:Uncharacterized protein n=1 Tax=Gryllus longicercus TaxID=2509291 RepID=A0AAN9VRL0_9ORTH
MRTPENCKYCEESQDESDIICRHVPYEETGYLPPCDPESSSESDCEYESTDIDTDSDEDGSWFTTPWTKLFPECTSDELDIDIGVKIFPVGEIPDKEVAHFQQALGKRLCGRRKRRIHKTIRKQTQYCEPNQEGHQEPKKT